MRPHSLLLILALGACEPFPQISTAGDAGGDYPALVPLGPILAQAAAPGQITPASVASMDARIASLRARAARLSGPVIAPATRARMRRGIAQAALR